MTSPPANPPQVQPKNLDLWVCIGDSIWNVSEPTALRSMPQRERLVVAALLKYASDELDELIDRGDSDGYS